MLVNSFLKSLCHFFRVFPSVKFDVSQLSDISSVRVANRRFSCLYLFSNHFIHNFFQLNLLRNIRQMLTGDVSSDLPGPALTLYQPSGASYVHHSTRTGGS